MNTFQSLNAFIYYPPFLNTYNLDPSLLGFFSKYKTSKFQISLVILLSKNREDGSDWNNVFLIT